jgi:hypothetical protein
MYNPLKPINTPTINTRGRRDCMVVGFTVDCTYFLTDSTIVGVLMGLSGLYILSH